MNPWANLHAHALISTMLAYSTINTTESYRLLNTDREKTIPEMEIGDCVDRATVIALSYNAINVVDYISGNVLVCKNNEVL